MKPVYCGGKKVSKLFDEPSLFVLHNNMPTDLSIDKIFDSEQFTKFYGVSYVSEPKFFAESILDFEEVTLFWVFPIRMLRLNLPILYSNFQF